MQIGLQQVYINVQCFYKNTLYKKTEARITQKLRTIEEQWVNWMQGPKNLERWEKDWKNQLKLDTQMSNEWTECTSSEETLQ